MLLLKKTAIIFYFLLFTNHFFCQNPAKTGTRHLNDLRSLYENFEENNEKAIPYVHNYIKFAQSENNYNHIFQGYKDLIYYSEDKAVKLKYADSCVVYSLQSKDPELISNAYLTRGIVYYFFYKKYQPALDEYLKAYDYSLKTKDQYLKNSIIYHLGVVKSYLGYYDEALTLFDKCIRYFEPVIKSKAHPNIIFNNQKGYFNSLHQQAICYTNLNDLTKSDSIVKYGISNLPKSNDFSLENAYFLKSKGILDFRKGKYQEAIINLDSALPALRANDFTWTSVSYFYLGKSYLELNQTEKAINYFTKVDSIFQKHNFLLPEVRENYEILINHYHQSGQAEKELFFTKQLLKADSILTRDFKYLASKIHKEYETKALLAKQNQLESINSKGLIVLFGSILTIAFLVITLIYRNKKQKKAQQRYFELEQRLIREKQDLLSGDHENKAKKITRKENKTEVPESVVEDLLEKLDKFESKAEFTKKGLTQSDLAKKFNTNTTYLSQVINEYKGNNFNTYLNILRINYITHELYHNPKFLDYTIEALTSYCGISSRQTFTDLFTEINDIRPTVFIKKRKDELKGMENDLE
ncbi:AraC family transcriptional regulator [Chryseobacterium sp.]|uniref:AraC family transcriptional regulator n=1 Tax=Chryseobacterium sp. TaxID=1871047 RepID=UPI0025BB0308|nr:AraC family transcriptional regulator [Chryseobacterium sp.]MBV8326775.1 tetratricopeptide repeat protein [Chryseobacterium sp.]